MLNEAFEALKTYNWGDDAKRLDPIDEAVVTTRDDPQARQELEKKLIEMLTSDISRDAKSFVCRKLRVVGTAASVPTLAGLLDQEEHAHMARYALERIPEPQAAQALRDAIPKLNGELKIGVIGSLGVRQDNASVPALAQLLGDSDPSVARSAALALGAIHSPQAAQALQAASGTSAAVESAVTDASLACAEALLAAGKKIDALKLYQRLAAGDRPKHVKLAATRGMLAAAGQSQ